MHGVYMIEEVTYAGRVATFCILAIGALLSFAGYQRSGLHIGSIWKPAQPESKLRAAWSMLVGPRNMHGANRRMVNIDVRR
jgi:hypothetical protein